MQSAHRFGFGVLFRGEHHRHGTAASCEPPFAIAGEQKHRKGHQSGQTCADDWTGHRRHRGVSHPHRRRSPVARTRFNTLIYLKGFGAMASTSKFLEQMNKSPARSYDLAFGPNAVQAD